MIGVLLLGFGAPRTLDDVGPFLRSILGEKRVTPEILGRTVEKYKAIGGGSPLPAITEKLAQSLQSHVGNDYLVSAAFLHSSPRIAEAMQFMARRGVKEVLGVSLAPHANAHSTWAYKKEAEEAARGLGMNFSLSGSYHTHPLYIQALSEKVCEKIIEAEASHLLVTAHSLPSGGDDVSTYSEEVEQTVKELLPALETDAGKSMSWSIAYQSRGPGQGIWLGPSVEERLDALSGQGVKDVLVLPVSFVSDHLETLYDVDVVCREKARSLGMSLRRVGALNDSSSFIDLLAHVVLKETS